MEPTLATKSQGSVASVGRAEMEHVPLGANLGALWPHGPLDRGGADMLKWKNLAWWRQQQAIPRSWGGARHGQRFNSNVDPELQLVAAMAYCKRRCEKTNPTPSQTLHTGHIVLQNAPPNELAPTTPEHTKPQQPRSNSRPWDMASCPIPGHVLATGILNHTSRPCCDGWASSAKTS